MTSDLASSLWHDTCREQILAPQLTEEVTADLVVIGGGYTGCAAALKAAGLGADVRLIEAGSFGSGGSGRNVGLANAGLWLPPRISTPKSARQLGAACPTCSPGRRIWSMT